MHFFVHFTGVCDVTLCAPGTAHNSKIMQAAFNPMNPTKRDPQTTCDDPAPTNQ